MFLRCKKRKKNGKEHRYWSIVENKRCAGGKVVQRHVLYLGEINDQQQAAWQKSIEVFAHGQSLPQTVALFPEDRPVEVADYEVVRVKLSELALRRPRQWGACWLSCLLYEQLQLDGFWAQRLPPSRKGTRWDLVLQTLCVYRLIDPGSEWRLHRQWFEQSAMGDLLGADFGALAESHKLYQCHDLILAHKPALFDHLTERWKDLFNARFDVLLYDLTSSYFERNPPFPEEDKRKHGYSRDKRPDCVQVVIALIVTPEGFPLAYEVMSGNTSDKTTLKGFLEKIEQQYGKAQRIHHKKQERVEAHIYVAFLAYCLHVTLTRRLKDLAPGLTARSVIEKFAAMQMIDVHLPTTDDREIILTRYTNPRWTRSYCWRN